jgi:DNA-binding NarL/FixJ family response regulator
MPAKGPNHQLDKDVHAMNEAVVNRGGHRFAKGAVRVAILEDHLLMREMLASALADEGFEVLQATHPEELFQNIAQQLPHVMIIDLTLDGHDPRTYPDGFSVLRRMHEIHPSVPLIVFSATRSPDAVQRSFEAGAQGYLFKLNATVDSLGSAIEQVMKGERVTPTHLSSSYAAAPDRSNGSSGKSGVKLTAREREVLSLVASGADNHSIARTLQIKERTVKAHVSRLYRKLGSQNRVELAIVGSNLGTKGGLARARARRTSGEA